MAFIPFPNGALAVLEYGAPGLNWTNTLWFEDLSGPPADYQGLADYLHGWAGSNIMPNIQNSFQLQNVVVYKMDDQYGQVFNSAAAAVTGSVGDSPAPINIALVVTFYSATRGRSGRGRNYITGFAEVDVGVIDVSNPTRVSNIAAAYTSMLTGVQTGPGFAWVVASRYGLGVPRTQVLPLPVVSVEVRSATLGNQRRRIDRT